MMHGSLPAVRCPQVYLYCGVVDMRRSFDGLMGIVQSEFEHDIRAGDLFVFINKRADRLKALWWDGDGLAIFMKNHSTECTHFKVFTEIARTHSFNVFAASAREVGRKHVWQSARKNEMPANTKGKVALRR